jgi:hypothetical protein
LSDGLGATFKSQHAAFLRSLVAERPSRRRSPGLAGHLCHHLKIGTASPEGDYIIYQHGDFERAGELLGRWRNGTAVAPEPSAASSRALVENLAQRYSRHYLAMYPLNMGYSFPPSCSFMSTTLRSARELVFDVIIACEKLNTLGRLDQYTWLEQFVKGRRALAVFCGARGGVYRAETAQRFVDGSAAPVMALHDFDPSGLHKASALPRLEALCLPDWQSLEPLLKNGRPEPMFAQHRRQLRNELDQVKCAHVATAWDRMNAIGNGISVEDFPR